MNHLQQVHLIVIPLIPDTIALTAQDTLRCELGLSDHLLSLKRRELWRFHIAKENPDEAFALVRKCAENTKLFINPNKHRYRIESAQKVINDILECEKNMYESNVFVYYRDETKADITLNALHKLYQLGTNIERLEYGFLWHIMWHAENMAQAQLILHKMLEIKDIEHGLLYNPHSQIMEFLSTETSTA